MAPKRVRGKNKVGGDVTSLVELHGLVPQQVCDGVLVDGDGGALAEAAFLARLPSKFVDLAWHPLYTELAGEAPQAERSLSPSASAPLALTVEGAAVHVPPQGCVTVGACRGLMQRIHARPSIRCIWWMPGAMYMMWRGRRMRRGLRSRRRRCGTYVRRLTRRWPAVRCRCGAWRAMWCSCVRWCALRVVRRCVSRGMAAVRWRRRVRMAVCGWCMCRVSMLRARSRRRSGWWCVCVGRMRTAWRWPATGLRWAARTVCGGLTQEMWWWSMWLRG